MGHFMRTVKHTFRQAGRVTSGMIGMYGRYKALGAMGSELYTGVQAARTVAGVASMAAPLALAL